MDQKEEEYECSEDDNNVIDEEGLEIFTILCCQNDVLLVVSAAGWQCKRCNVEQLFSGQETMDQHLEQKHSIRVSPCDGKEQTLSSLMDVSEQVDDAPSDILEPAVDSELPPIVLSSRLKESGGNSMGTHEALVDPSILALKACTGPSAIFRKIACNFCKMEFTSRIQHYRHMEEVHGCRMHPNLARDRKIFRCRLCSEEFLGRATRLQHMRIAHGGEEGKPYICKSCGANFRYKHELQVHAANGHCRVDCSIRDAKLNMAAVVVLNALKIQDCNFSGSKKMKTENDSNSLQVLSDESTLTDHLEQDHFIKTLAATKPAGENSEASVPPQDIKTNSSSYRDKDDRSQLDMVLAKTASINGKNSEDGSQSLPVKSGIKKIVCKVCHAEFKYHCQRTRHMNSKHRNHSNKWKTRPLSTKVVVRCRLCSMDFSSLGARLRHTRLEHGRDQQKPYFCAHCRHRFRYLGNLQQHLQKRQCLPLAGKPNITSTSDLGADTAQLQTNNEHNTLLKVNPMHESRLGSKCPVRSVSAASSPSISTETKMANVKVASGNDIGKGRSEPAECEKQKSGDGIRALDKNSMNAEADKTHELENMEEIKQTLPAESSHRLYHVHPQKLRSSGRRTDRKRVLCRFCDKDFGTRSARLRHERKVHGGAEGKPYSCKYCFARFRYIKEMVLHHENAICIRDKNTLDVSSGLLSEIGDSSSNARWHMNLQTKSFEFEKDSAVQKKTVKKNIPCQDCESAFECKYQIQIHRWLVHIPDERIPEKARAGLELKEMVASLLKRVDVHSELYQNLHLRYSVELAVTFFCDLCNQKLTDGFRGVLRHVWGHYINPYKQELFPDMPMILNCKNIYLCTDCGEEIQDKIDVISYHRLTVHNTADAYSSNLKCGHCGLIFHHRFLKLKHEKEVHSPAREWDKEVIIGDAWCKETTLPAHSEHSIQSRNALEPIGECSNSKTQNESREKILGMNTSIQDIETNSSSYVDKDDCSKSDLVQAETPSTSAKNWEEVSQNLSGMSGMKKMVCGICRAEFKSFSQCRHHIYRRHRKYSKTKAQKALRCRQCCMEFLNRGARLHHLRQEHGGVEQKPYFCQCCHLRFRYLRDLKQHLLKGPCPPAAGKLDTQGTDAAQSQSGLQAWWNETTLPVHSEQDHSIQCRNAIEPAGECSKTQNESREKILGMNTSIQDIKTNTSSYVDKEDSSQSDLVLAKTPSTSANSSEKVNQNLSAMSGMKKTVCGVCHAEFESLSQCRRHMNKRHRKHSKTKAKKPLHCRQCGMEFFNRGARLLHLRQEHGGVEQKPYFCQRCHLRFRYLKELKQHLLKGPCPPLAGKLDTQGTDAAQSQSGLQTTAGKLDTEKTDTAQSQSGLQGDEDSFPCKDCAAVFECEYQTQVHRWLVHISDEEKPETCRITPELSENIASFMKQVEQGSEGLKKVDRKNDIKTFVSFFCERCNKPLRDRVRTIIGHLWTHYVRPHRHVLFPGDAPQKPPRAKATGMFLCTICGDENPDRVKDISYHLLTKHDIEDAYSCNLKCKVCSAVFMSKGSKASHEKQAHGSPKEIFICDLCGESFGNQLAFYNHKQCHLSPMNMFTCGVCNHNFPSEKILSKHEALHTKPSLFCTHCGKEFLKLYSLQSHIKITHQREYKFKCGQCSAQFSTPSRLKLHVEVKHEGLRPLKCFLCPETFVCRPTLRRHIRRMHKKHTPFICEVCSKPFYERRYLMRHMVEHGAPEPFRCPHCQKALTSENSRQDHIRRCHKDLLSYLCRDCEQLFETEEMLQRHKQKYCKIYRARLQQGHAEKGAVEAKPNCDTNTGREFPLAVSTAQTATANGLLSVELGADWDLGNTCIISTFECGNKLDVPFSEPSSPKTEN